MSMEEAGTVIYFGVFASFFGGWVPVRAKSFKLTVFHLYVFLSLLAFPVLIYLVNSDHVIGWVIYALLTGVWFTSIKIINYRLHKALGTDPVSENQSKADQDENEEDMPDQKLDISDQNECEDDEKQNEDITDLENQQGLEEEIVSNIENEDDDDIKHHRSSASTLNDATNSTCNPTPDIELSLISHTQTSEVDTTPTGEHSDEQTTPPDEDEEKGVVLSINVLNSPVHQNIQSTSDEILDFQEDISTSHPNGRQRVCHRMQREESLSSRRGVQNTNIIEQVQTKLNNDNYTSLQQVVDKMSSDVHEAILSGSIPLDNYNYLESRVPELKRGQLAVSLDDATPGAIHWVEQEDGTLDFYMFESVSERVDPMLAMALQFQQEDDIIPPLLDDRPSTPLPFPTPVTISLATHNDEPLPSILLLPRVKKTKVNLVFARTQLEEYMDRNVSKVEVLLTITLAVLVCVIGALLLTTTNFFRDFWVFWLCFVMATGQFSLIKSVQSDPASPSPGQNRINAMSRAIYFIFIGVLGLILDAAINSNDDFSPLCVYGFNLNSRSVLLFVRNGLFIFILFHPLVFTLGWMPQFDTFLINILEQIDIHVFGGTASTGLVCSIYSLCRNLLVVGLLLPFGYTAFVYLEKDTVTNITGQCFFTYFDFTDKYLVISSQCTAVGRIGLSFFLGCVVSMSYILSRATTNHQYIFDIVQTMWRRIRKSDRFPVNEDPLDKMYRDVMLTRLKVDIFVGVILLICVTVINITTVFCQTQILGYVIFGITSIIGIFNHYIIPHVRKENPYLCFTEPCLKSNEYDKFEVTVAPKVSVMEKILQVTLFVEKNVLYPFTFLLGINYVAVYYNAKFGNFGAALVVAVVGMKIFRSAYSEVSRQHVVLILSLLFFNVDYRHLSEGLPLDYFITAILFNKIYDLYLKIYFIFIYIMPGSWSHPFHIIIQPLLIPHCPLIFFETLIGAIVSAPMNPLVASSMFFLSYARPIKFWEKNYNTKRQDTTNTRLEQTLEGNLRNPNPDHLDSLFYEQLTWSLQRDLCGDIILGRWGRVTSGDIFVLTNDQLNALVHIIEIGNGFVTFQLRGLEFRGTYCHQREREAITEPLADNDDACHLPYILPCKKLCIARWMAWEVISSSYTLHGYSISENQAHLVFNAFVYKKAFITYYVRCIIYYLIKSPRLNTLLNNNTLEQTLHFLNEDDSCDVDPLFAEMFNIDWDPDLQGIGRDSFLQCYYDLIQVCSSKHVSSDVDTGRDSFLVTLCFAFSLLGRRMFFTHSNTGSGRREDNFMHGLYRMFLGDARPSSERDEWIIMDVDSIHDIIIPASRIALKVHQDNFTLSEQYESPDGMYEAMNDAEQNHVITHENDRAWRDAVVLNRPSLLALRYQRTEDTYIHPYKIIRLTSKFIKFRLVKVNRECVRGLWSSQQHELIFLRNSDNERGSIQNHSATLRNMINSSMDLPIGYPIYVSPLQTSFLNRHTPFNDTRIGQLQNPLQYAKIFNAFKTWCSSCLERYKNARNQPRSKTDTGVAVSSTDPLSPPVDALTGDLGYIDPFGDSDSDDDFWKPIWIGKQVVITNVEEVFETFNEGWLQWPDKSWLRKSLKTSWKYWYPVEGVTSGEVIHEWRPFHITATSRSHIDKVILLVRVNECNNYLLIKEQGVQAIS